MDSTAIQRLVDLGAERSQVMNTDIPAIIKDKQSDVQSLEHLLARPKHHKAFFSTALIDEFVAYASRNAADNKHSSAYIDTESMTAQTIFDHGDALEPQWGHHRAQLRLKQLPEYKALLQNNNRDLSQQDFVDFLSDWKSSVFFEDESFLTVLNRIRKLTVTNLSKAESEIGNFNATASALESVEVSAGSTKPPEEFMFNCTPYEQFGQRVFLCEIRAKVDGSNIKLRYRIQQLDAITDDIAREFKTKLSEQLNGMLTISVGVMNHRNISVGVMDHRN
jgi:uncharacterized protein YfdQ (DUF2303 family)